VRNRVLCVSDRTLYVLQNLAGMDAEFRSRYAVLLSENEYQEVSPVDGDLWTLFKSVTNNIQLEVLTMDCDLTELLTDIRDRLITIQAQSGIGGAMCCNYTIDPGNYYDADSGSGDQQDKCDLAWNFAEYWARGTKEMYHQWVLGAFPAAGVLTAILDQFDLPASIVLEIITFGASQALPYLESAWADVVDALTPLVACAVVTNTDSAGAKAAIDAQIDGLPDIHPTAAYLLKAVVTNTALNQVYAGTWTIETTGHDCDQCFEQEGALVQTAFYYEFNRLIVGEDIEFNAQDPGYGYESENSGQALDIYFNLDTAVPSWYFAAQAYVVGVDPDNAGMVVERWDGSSWQGLSQQYSWNNIPSQTWTPIEVTVTDDPLDNPGACRVHLGCQGFHNFIRFRKVILQDISE
jgi:hypothetical protein